MSHEPPACPYCNAFVPSAAGAETGRRVLCPRCGETFTLRQPTDPQEAAPAPPPADEPPPRPRRSNGVVAAWVLGAMAVMASVGLAFALYTTGVRRAHDTALPPPPRKSPLTQALPAEAPATPPAALQALRWLPPETTLVAGIQVAEMRQTEAGRGLMKHSVAVGNQTIDLGRLEQWTGLKMDEIDHIVLGVKAEDGVPPPAILVVRLRWPYDAPAVKAALKAETVPDSGGKVVYQCNAHADGPRPFLWQPDERTLVFALLEKHLASLPDKPAAGPDRLAPELRELVEQRLQAGGPVWAAGHSADWRKTGAALFLGELPRHDADLAGRVHDFVLQLEAGAPARLTASFRCDDPAAAGALEARLTAARQPNRDGGFRTARDGPWVTLQRRGDPATFLEDLRK